MKKIFSFLAIAICLFFVTAFTNINTDNDWVSLFDGKTLNNWNVGDNAATFSVENGMIVVNGPTAHLFYNGDVNNHTFKNFEFVPQLIPEKVPMLGVP